MSKISSLIKKLENRDLVLAKAFKKAIFGMANVRPKRTGLSMPIFISDGDGSKHGLISLADEE